MIALPVIALWAALACAPAEVPELAPVATLAHSNANVLGIAADEELGIPDALLAVVEGATVHLYDLADPAQPLLLNSTGDEARLFFPAVVRDDELWVGTVEASPSQIWRLDLTQPSTATLLADVGLDHGLSDLALVEDTLYISDSDPDFGALYAYETPDGPGLDLLGELHLDSASPRVAAQDGLAWLSTGLNGVVTVDAADPSALEPVSALGRGEGSTVVPDGQVVWALTDGELTAYDFSQPAAPKPLGTVPATSAGVLADGDRMITDQGVFDVADPSAPTWLATLPSPGAGWQAVTRVDSLVVRGGASGVEIYADVPW